MCSSKKEKNPIIEILNNYKILDNIYTSPCAYIKLFDAAVGNINLKKNPLCIITSQVSINSLYI